MTRVEEMAAWAADVSLSDVPAEVLELCRDQRRSVLAAIAASADDPASQRVLDGLARNGAAGVEGALYAGAALSVALDFDDYVCFGHTGHSSVLVPILVGAETGAGGADQLLAQVIANEVEARLGGACLIGPLNGQLWSFIHAAGAALAAGRLLGLDRGRMAHALAIALYQAPRPTVPGFMAPDSKLLTASEPSVIGLRAARLAAAGVTGPLDALDHRQGFLSAFAFTPLPAILGGLGQGWATRTLCIKPYPGCAYVDTTVDALLELGPVDAEAVDRVVVDASILTCQMDKLSAEYATGGDPTPVTVNFSIPWNVAITLVGGRLSPDEVRPEWMSERRRQLASLAQRVELNHDWELTRSSAESFAAVLPTARLVGSAGGMRRLGRGLRRVRGEHPSIIGGVGDLRGMRALVRNGRRLTAGRRRPFWDDQALRSFRMSFPARVTVHLRDGRRLEARADVPRGGAGHPTEGPGPVSRDKVAAWCGPDVTEAVAADSPDLARHLGPVPAPT